MNGRQKEGGGNGMPLSKCNEQNRDENQHNPFEENGTQQIMYTTETQVFIDVCHVRQSPDGNNYYHCNAVAN